MLAQSLPTPYQKANPNESFSAGINAFRLQSMGTYVNMPVPGVNETTGYQGSSSQLVMPAFFGMHYSSPVQPWPTASFSTLRLWDSWPGISWRNISPSKDVYNWTDLDNIVNIATSQGVEIVYTFGGVPAWASTNPNGGGCAYGNGSCYMPNISDWKTFVTQVTTRYKGKIKYWEIWNEPNAGNFWSGTTTQMVSIAQAAYSIIKNSGGVVLSPSPQGTNAHQWLDSYFAADGASYADIVAFHGYLYGAPELIVPLTANIKNVMAKYSLNNKPLWDTEHSWGDSTWPFGADQDQQSAWLARFKLLSISSGIERSLWYMWDGYDGQHQWGMLFNATTKQIQKPGIAHREIYKWIVNANMDSCTLSGNVYQCRITRNGGYEGLIMWSTNGTTSYNVPSKYIHYLTLDATSVNTPPGSVITLGMKPILLEADVTTGLDSERQQENSPTIYPNPFTSTFTLKISSGTILKDAVMKIYDVCGKEVKSIWISSNETSIDRDGLQDGIYFYKLITGNQILSFGKLVMQ